MSTCESCCGHPAQVTLSTLPVGDFIESYAEIALPFKLCLRCVPVEQVSVVEPLAGFEDVVELELALLAFHRPAAEPGVVAGVGR